MGKILIWIKKNKLLSVLIIIAIIGSALISFGLLLIPIGIIFYNMGKKKVAKEILGTKKYKEFLKELKENKKTSKFTVLVNKHLKEKTNSGRIDKYIARDISIKDVLNKKISNLSHTYDINVNKDNNLHHYYYYQLDRSTRFYIQSREDYKYMELDDKKPFIHRTNEIQLYIEKIINNLYMLNNRMYPKNTNLNDRKLMYKAYILLFYNLLLVYRKTYKRSLGQKLNLKWDIMKALKILEISDEHVRKYCINPILAWFYMGKPFNKKNTYKLIRLQWKKSLIEDKHIKFILKNNFD